MIRLAVDAVEAPVTRLIRDLERRAAEAERIQATAPVAAVLNSVIAELRALNGGATPDPGNGTSTSPIRLLTVKQAAKLLRVNTKWIYRHGDLPFVRRVGGAVRVDPRALERWLARRA